MQNEPNSPAVVGRLERVRPLAETLRALPTTTELRAWADNPANNQMVPVHPDTLRALAHAIDQMVATFALETIKRQPMTAAQVDHLVTHFHRTRRFHGSEPADIVRAVETFHGIHATVADERPNVK